MFDELGIGDVIDQHIPQADTFRKLSIGTICKALVINGLGFSQRRLYMVEDFFRGKPCEELLGQGVTADMLNDSVLARALDSLYESGCTDLFGLVSAAVCRTLGLSGTFAHLDTSSFHLDGRYNSGQDKQESVIHLTKGYSRDHRPDLNQAVLSLIVEQQSGIPIHMEALDGNSSDKVSFRETIALHIKGLDKSYKLDYLVMDSAGYTRETLELLGNSQHWISRVPERISECKQAVTGHYEEWTDLEGGYSCQSLSSNYADIPQRWLLVFSKQAYAREAEALHKAHKKGSQKEEKAFRKLAAQAFCCRKDAEKALADFAGKAKFIELHPLECHIEERHKGRGRPRKGATPVKEYYPRARLASSLTEIDRKRAEKGRFIIATNQGDKGKMTDKQLLEAYKGQAKVEKGFRFMKDPQFIANTFFVKKPERVEVMLFLMTLCLTVYAAIEYRIRQQLKEKQETLPNQINKQVQNPTARWVFQSFQDVHVLYIAELNKKIVTNLSQFNIKVLELMGERYCKYYQIRV